MAKFDFTKRDSFGSRIGVIAAAAGSAIGLGNIWRFPYVAGENGGGAFLLIYVGFIVLIGVPVMLSEFTIGRRAQRNAYGSFKLLKPKQPWYLIGLMGIAAAFMILAFYSTVAGWTLEYLINAISNNYAGKTPEQLSNMFDSFVSLGFKPVIFQVIFMFLTAWIVYSGVRHGIERYAKILMPILLLIIIVLGIRSVTLEGAGEGLNFLFNPDFSKIDTSTVLEALGQAFFSLSIGMGTLITYGSYINKKENLSTTAFEVSAADTAIAILAGVAIFPAMFAFGVEPNTSGEGLVFKILPLIFNEMPGGFAFQLLFCFLLIVAALTSTISVLEVVVAYFSEELGVGRKIATVIAASSIGFLGIFCTLSFGPLQGLDLFEIFNFTSANILLPLGGLLIVIFVGWFLGRQNVYDEISNSGILKVRLYKVFLIIVRFVAPIAIALVFMHGIGIIRI
ncbi:MAG: sodium-dependent transporter [Bacteroidales bacterium]|nr:sodium-dependent transporter [Bacteroidales bacterium]MCF8386344.1 sodium-dependent transporter [Bacteroidales bacterium]MCF8396814.1 sodium-dependent transporter [Bacteroidales bacterium]